MPGVTPSPGVTTRRTMPEPSRAKTEAMRVSRRNSPTSATALLRVAGRDELAEVREGALDQLGDHLDVLEPEQHLRLAGVGAQRRPARPRRRAGG